MFNVLIISENTFQNLLRMKRTLQHTAPYGVSATPYSVSAAPYDESAAPYGMSAALHGVLALQDTHGTSRGA